MSDLFAWAARADIADLQQRRPELIPLKEAVVVCTGLGCVGAPSVLEFARAGVGQLRLVDHDLFDPATAARWPLGFSVAGLPKVDILKDFIQRNWPYTKVDAHPHRIGGVRPARMQSDDALVRVITRDCHLIYDTTAEIGVQHFLSDLARTLRIPYISATATYGGWGGTIVRIRPGRTEGCWMCYRHAEEDGTLPKAPGNEADVIQPLGCGDPTTTGAGFDMAEVALMGVRLAASTLCDGVASAYPRANWDLATIAYRQDKAGPLMPQIETFQIRRHSECQSCPRT